MSALPHSVHVHCRDLTRGREQSGNTWRQSSASHRGTLKQNNSYTAELQRRVQAMDMRCYRKILRISYKDHVTNKASPCQAPAGNRTTQRPPDHRKEMQTVVVWTCIKFIRSGQNHLAKHGERGKKRRADNSREWTGLNFARSLRAVGRREKLRTQVVKLSVVPQRPSWLRDRWRWRSSPPPSFPFSFFFFFLIRF